MKKTPWFIFIGTLAAYWLTLAPTVTGGDGGEFLAAACSGGVAHPPGYPLYVLLAQLAFHLHIGSMAWRMNFFSAICDAAATTFLFLSLHKETSRLFPSLAGALLFAFSPLIWTYAVQTEVFALNNLFICLLIYEAVSFNEKPSPQIFYATALISGLAVSNHHTSVFVSFPILLWMFASIKENRWKTWLPAKILFLIGLLPYLSLWIGAGHPGAVIWGDPTGWKGLVGHILRLNYGTFRLATENSGPTSPLDLWFLFVKDWGRESLYIGYLLAPLGLALGMAAPKKRKLATLLVLIFFFYLGIFHGLANLRLDTPLFVGIVKRFWQEADIILFLGMGIAFAFLDQKIKIPFVIKSFCVLVVLCQILIHWSQQDMSGHYSDWRLAESILMPLPNDAVLLIRGDLPTNAVNYAQRCEKMRPDVRVLNQTAMTYPWFEKHLGPEIASVNFPGVIYTPQKSSSPTEGTYDMKDFLNANVGKVPVFVAGGFLDNDTSYTHDFFLWPAGLIDEVHGSGENPGNRNWASFVQRNWALINQLDFKQLQSAAEDSWDHEILREVLRIQEEAVFEVLTMALSHPEEEKLFEIVATEMPQLISHQPNPPAYLYKNLGLTYQHLMRFHFPDAETKMRQAWEQYLTVAPPTDPELPLIRKLLAGEN